MSKGIKTEALTAEFPVRYAETDAMGVVHHASYLVYFEEARSKFMRDMGIEYADIEADGFRLPVTEVTVRYVGSLRYGDTVKIRAWIEENRSRRLNFAYEVLAPASLIVLVSGKTQHIWTDASGTVCRAPEQWAQCFTKT